MEKDLKIAVAGTGYVGLSMATLLAQHHEVMAVDVVPAHSRRLHRAVSARETPATDGHIGCRHGL